MRFLADESLQRAENDQSAWGLTAGAELAYNLNKYVSVVAGGQFRSVRDDGFDGWDYGSGSDHFLRFNLGFKYRIAAHVHGAGEIINRSDVNIWTNRSGKSNGKAKDCDSE